MSDLHNTSLLVVHELGELARLVRSLRTAGFDVHEAATVREALAVAECKPCELLITSRLDLKDGDAETLIATLRSQYQMRGIALIGFVTNERAEAAARAGFARFFLMPCSFRPLLAAIRQLANGRTQIWSKALA